MESEKLAMAPKKRGMVTRGWSDFWKPPIFDTERDHQLCDKTVVITGGNCGIGLATAMECAKRGAHVVLVCRNEEKMIIAKTQILNLTPTATITTIVMDLKSFSSVRNAAVDLRSKISSIDIIIMNAGTIGIEFELVEGIHALQVVNHFSHFLFLNLIIDLLNFERDSPPRVISLASGAHAHASGDFKFWERYDSVEVAKQSIPTSDFPAYGESKLANILHMRHLATLRPDIRCFSVHPGGVKTDIGDDLQSRMGCFGAVLGFIAFGLFGWLFRTPFQGAQTTLYCAMSDDCDASEVSGRYFYDCTVGQITVKNKSDEELCDMQQRLWRLSEEYTKSTLPS